MTHIEAGKRYRVSFEAVAAYDGNIGDGVAYGDIFSTSQRVNHVVEEVLPKTFGAGDIVRNKMSGTVYAINPDGSAVVVGGDAKGTHYAFTSCSLNGKSVFTEDDYEEVEL